MPMSSSGLPARLNSAMRSRDPREVRRARRAVDECDAVQQKRRRECTEQEVLQRALGRPFAAAVDAGERVDRDRHQLDAEEHDHEIARGGEEHHAGRREQDEHVRFGRLDAAMRMLSSMLSAIAKTVPSRMTTSTDQRKLSSAIGPGPALKRPIQFRREQNRNAAQDDARHADIALMGVALWAPRRPEQQDHCPAHEDEVGDERQRQLRRNREVER